MKTVSNSGHPVRTLELRLSFALTFLTGCLLAVPLNAAPPTPNEPTVAAASGEGRRALHSFQLQAGLEARLFAAEPIVANPVAFYVDSRGRVFVCESFRQNQGVTDNRRHDQQWLESDLSAQTVDDRRAYHLAQLGDDLATYTAQDDRIRLVIDYDGDGTADRSTVFADRFNDLVEGTGAGVLEHNGDVYYTCIPRLWRLRDDDEDGTAEFREALHDGYGVRVAFRGHDLHGLRMGPDGRVYFTIGDRGYHVETEQGVFSDPSSGAVFRCELDGSKLEVMATGLRNPQEIAFDNYGNLFTCDNNSDSGDRARWLYLAEGGDFGWRMHYQYLSDRGPYNREKIWHPYHSDQPSYVVPPIANISDGPSGLDFYPGTGMPDEFQNRFFLCDFRGMASMSGIRSFGVEARGAFFELVAPQQPVWQILATDLQFAPDGSLLVSDWVNGWDGVGKGRLYRFVSPEHEASPLVLETRQLLAANFSEHAPERLVGLLDHADQRVRQRAQFELAERGESAALLKQARGGNQLLGRLHAMWGAEQIARTGVDRQQVTAGFRELLSANEMELRAHAARLLGELRDPAALESLKGLLKDSSARVRYFAALSLSKLADSSAVEPIVAMLAENDDRDPILRHGGIVGLTHAGDPVTLRAAGNHPSASVRRAVVVAYRRRGSVEVAEFLADDDPRVVLEAARAIHDLPIPEAMPRLADLLEKEPTDDALLRRALNANFREGKPKNLRRLARFVASPNAPTDIQLQTVDLLRTWVSPSNRDWVLGEWRPLEGRDEDSIRETLRAMWAELSQAKAEPRLAIAMLAAEYGVVESQQLLTDLLNDSELPGQRRAEVLGALTQLDLPNNSELLRAGVKDSAPEVRAAARNLLAKVAAEEAIGLLADAAENGTTVERQMALATLGKMDGEAVNEVLLKQMQHLLNGQVPSDTRLDLVLAVQEKDHSDLRAALSRYTAQRDDSDPMSKYADALVGGDAARGKDIFLNRREVSCVRCHRLTEEGTSVGPALTKIGAEKKRDYLLAAIVDPNRDIAKGFESTLVVDDVGKVYAGILKHEDDNHLELLSAEGETITILQESVDERVAGKSAMPADLVNQLTQADVRDLVQFLSELDGTQSQSAGPTEE